MGTILILIGGLIGAGSAFKKTFTTSWIFLINLSFALYCSIFLAPFMVSLLDFPWLAAGYKNIIAVGSIFIVTDLILQNITSQIIHNTETDYNLPPVAKFFSIASGFLSGAIIVGILVYCFVHQGKAFGTSIIRGTVLALFIDKDGDVVGQGPAYEHRVYLQRANEPYFIDDARVGLDGVFAFQKVEPGDYIVFTTTSSTDGNEIPSIVQKNVTVDNSGEIVTIPENFVVYIKP